MVLQRNPDVVWRDEPAQKEAIFHALENGEDVSEHGWVILVSDGQMVELNLMAGEIWLLMDGSRDNENISRILAERYDAPPEEIRADVEDFVILAQQRGWLRKAIP